MLNVERISFSNVSLSSVQLRSSFSDRISAVTSVKISRNEEDEELTANVSHPRDFTHEREDAAE